MFGLHERIGGKKNAGPEKAEQRGNFVNGKAGGREEKEGGIWA